MIKQLGRDYDMPTLIQMKKVSDEGSSSPFMARLFVGLLELRDSFHLLDFDEPLREQHRSYFDSRFKPLFEAAQATRDSAVEARKLITTHVAAIEEGRVVQIKSNQFDINETIDSPLSQAIDKLIDQGVVAIKTGLQRMLHDPLGLEIGFIFQKSIQFDKGITECRQSGENHLADYLDAVRRTWLTDFQKLRVDHEHCGWNLESIKYHLISPSTVDVQLPKIYGLHVDQFANLTANRVLLFIENMMVYAMVRKCPHPFYVVEIPKNQRDPANQRRFRIAAKGLTSTPPWVISYSEEMELV